MGVTRPRALAISFLFTAAACSLANVPDEPLSEIPATGGPGGTTAASGASSGGEGGEGGDCEGPLTTLDNCGECGNKCQPDNANGATCETGNCAYDECVTGFQNCDQDAANGCESEAATDVKNCGGCGMACDMGQYENVENVACTAATCGFDTCKALFGDCDTDETNGCETPINTLSDCGGCGTTCAPENAVTPNCSSGMCDHGGCAGTYGDCDSDTANGCEADLNTNDAHCGACGNPCMQNESCSGGGCVSAPLTQATYNSSVSFADALNSTTMMLAWDGSFFWSVSGGGSSGVRLAKYDKNGVTLNTFSRNIDFRSIFTIGDGKSPVVARGHNSAKLIEQVSDGVFNGIATLIGGSLNAQASVVWDDTNKRYVAQDNGVVSRWTANGTFAGNVNLVGYGSQNQEDATPQRYRMATGNGYYLTYSNGTASAWDPATGQRVDSAKLTGAGTDSQAHYGFSHARGYIWVRTTSTWLGYDVGL